MMAARVAAVPMPAPVNDAPKILPSSSSVISATGVPARSILAMRSASVYGAGGVVFLSSPRTDTKVACPSLCPSSDFGSKSACPSANPFLLKHSCQPAVAIRLAEASNCSPCASKIIFCSAVQDTGKNTASVLRTIISKRAFASLSARSGDVARSGTMA